MATRTTFPENPLHMHCAADTAWTTTNTSEAMPGVLTPLSWAFWGDSSERLLRTVFAQLGALSRREAAEPRETADRCFAGIFYGRVAGNLTVMRNIGDRIPGTSGDAVEEQIFGGLESGLKNRPVRRRYPFVAVKAPAAVLGSVRRIQRARDDNKDWWRAAVAQPPSDVRAAVALFEDATARFEFAMSAHVIITMVAQALYDRLIVLEREAGLDDAMNLATGYGAMEETLMLQGLWEVAHERLTLAGFLERYGYHGPLEGDVSSRSWREDPAPLNAPIAGFANVPIERSPREVELARTDVRMAAERALRDNTARVKRPAVALVLRLARRFILYRQIGKVAFLLAIDGARLAARAAGARLEQDDVLEHAEDVFQLTADELCGRAPMPDRETIAERKAIRAEFLALDVPVNWSGQPEPVVARSVSAAGAQADDDAPISGLTGSAGCVEGRVRVIHDPASESIEPGEIIVCAATDPSWTPLLFLAAALVVDIGGAMSHAAIVARELGIPCVMGTIDGTKRLHDGELIRVDGAAASVTVLDPAQPGRDPRR